MNVLGAFRLQSEACTKLGSPFMGQLMSVLSERLTPGDAVSDKVLNWSGDPTPSADSVPLRLAGALHALRLEDKALESVYPPSNVSDDTLWSGIVQAFDEHSDQIIVWLGSPPQTNEVRRSAVILPALALLQEKYDRPVALYELGTSGGLNLRADLFRLDLGDTSIGPDQSAVVLKPKWHGERPPTKLPKIMKRRGVDLNPIDPSASDGRLRLLAYLWPDQPERIQLTERAIEIATDNAADVESGDAGAWLGKEFQAKPDAIVRLVFHTVAWQYFSDETKARAESALRKAASSATLDAPLARLSMEDSDGKSAAVTLTTWPGGETHLIARANFHGRWVDWRGCGARQA
ncbi:MAG: DUF2332 domain-containing protein [Boseongicola sp.]